MHRKYITSDALKLRYYIENCRVVLCLMLMATTAWADTDPYSESATFIVDTSAPRMDTDGDGMPDSYEMAVGLNFLANDANEDADGDGIMNIQEYNSGTHPLTPDMPQLSQGVSAMFTVNTGMVNLDTDGDGIPDTWEIAHGLDWTKDDANEDADGDGLTNIEEYNAGTDPQTNDSPVVSVGVSAFFTVNTAVYPFPLTTDTDRDGMPDWWEQEYGLDPGVNDANEDADGDGVPNLAEYQQGRNPVSNELVIEVATVSGSFTLDTRVPRVDSDGDGIPDSWEIAHGLNQFANDASEDPDGDGRTNLEEYNSGTDPQIDDWRVPSSGISGVFLADTGGIDGSPTRDTDGDGMPDWWEIQYGLDRFINDANGDVDGDGISNLDEYNSGSNPIVHDHPPVVGVSGVFLVDTGGLFFDTDGDGLPDWWEKLYFNDPRAAIASADTDTDGYSNYAEFISGSNPLDAGSVFRVSDFQSVRETNGTVVVIRWMSIKGSRYSIWSATEAQGPYSEITANIVATPPQNVVTNLVSGSNRYFRVGVSR